MLLAADRIIHVPLLTGMYSNDTLIYVPPRTDELFTRDAPIHVPLLTLDVELEDGDVVVAGEVDGRLERHRFQR